MIPWDLQGHIPRMKTLFRLADYLGTPRGLVLRLGADMPVAGMEEEKGEAETAETKAA